ncbi:S9 family peptidase [Aliiglaciecola sp. 2_MG-2023]|uniref:alpha/beta hydrolase family protein n=1 Tax=unclassified Aliiglaciecola TaxID=2593648 RepID=UPI0026E2D44B|nr:MULTISPECIES: S9 family peptidase [unclassified Aliiglaciecola]MDO6713188.1 S9 family peptidase [Aliiglaciecola sp. 2_MG-2023]MDO6754268.1 S9 family peptidase [Aliiglaciecola sp. 1_MG-2023]
MEKSLSTIKEEAKEAYMKTCLIFALLLFCSSVLASKLPIDQFSKHSDYLDMTISPDGKHLLARVQHEGEVSLVFLDAKNMKIVGGVRPKEGDAIHSAQWVSDERVVYQFAEKRLRYDAPIATGELFAINVDGSKQEMLYGWRARENGDRSTRTKKREASYATPEIISLLVDDEKNILILEHPWTLEHNQWYDLRKKHSVISKLNIFNGRKTKVEVLPHPGAHAIANKFGEINFIKWHDENLEVHGAYREKRDSRWLEIVDAFGVNKDLVPTGTSNDGKKILLTGSYGKRDLNTYYVLDLTSKKLSPIFDDMVADIAYTNREPLTNMPVVGISYPGKPQYHYVEENKTAKLHKMLVEAFGEQEVNITSSTRDGKKLLVRVSSDVNPGEYYIFDTEKMGAEFIWSNRSWLDPRTMAPMQAFQFTTEDNMVIHGYLTMPLALKENEKPPMVVVIHGGPHGISETWEFNSEVQFLANRGYAVLQVNFRGSGGYGKQFEQAGYRQWGGKMIKDITDATKYVVSQGYVDGEKMCVYGASYGGYAALMASVREPELYNCTIGYVGIYDLNYAYTDSIYMKSHGGRGYFEKVLGTNARELAQFSPVNYADKIKSDVLLIHGEKDSIVSVKNAQAMLASFEAVGKKVDYINFEKGGHGLFQEAGRRQVYAALEEFINQHINK